MWAHTVVTLLGLWLVITPIIFRVPTMSGGLWLHDLSVGLLIMAFGAFSVFRKFDFLRLFNLLISLYLIIRAHFFFSHPRPPLEQNHYVIGLLLLMFIILPRWTNLPPEAIERSQK